MTNEQKIKAMSTKELRDFIYNCVSCDSCPFHSQCIKTDDECYAFLLNWLKEEAEE